MTDPRHPAPSLNQQPQPVQPLHPQQPRPVMTPRPAVAAPTAPRPPQAAPGIARPPQAPAPKSADAPITLDDEADDAAATPTRKIVFGPEVGHKKHDWQRHTHATGTGACRVRSFHG